MASGTYVDPGYAVASQVDDILTKRRLEARQAMLDALNQQNVQSQIRDRDENTRTNAANRASLAEDRLAQAGQRWESNFPIDANITPEQYEQAKKYHIEGNFTPPSAGVGADFEGPIDTSTTGQTQEQARASQPGKFLGTSKDRETKARRDRTLAYLDSEEAQKGMSPLERSLMRIQIENGDTNLQMPSGAFKGDTPTGVYVLGADGRVTLNGQPVDASKIPANAKVERGFQPRAGASATSGKRTNIDAQGNIWITDLNTNTTIPSRVATPKPTAPEPPEDTLVAAPSKPGVQSTMVGPPAPVVDGVAVTPESFNNDKASQQAPPKPAPPAPPPSFRVQPKSSTSQPKMPSYSLFVNAKMAADKTPGNAQLQAAANQLAAKVAQESGFGPDVAQLAEFAYASPQFRKMTAEQVLAAVHTGNETADDVNQFRTLWGILTGNLAAPAQP